MAKKKPEPTKLEQMHDALTDALLKRVRDGSATASDLNVARQFLKDNNVEVRDPKADTKFTELAATLPFQAGQRAANE